MRGLEPIPPQTNPHIPLMPGQVYDTGKDERTPYAWPMAELPREFDTPLRRLSEGELRERLRLVKLLFDDMGTTKWRHYKGTVYEVTGFGVSARDGQIEVEYRDTAMRGAGATFHLPIHEWFTTVVFDSVPEPTNPNLVDPDGHFMVHRYVPVFDVNSYETKRQYEERGK